MEDQVINKDILIQQASRLIDKITNEATEMLLRGSIDKTMHLVNARTLQRIINDLNNEK